ncbi:hypothetical protein O6H91_13G069100 [Diphasiastrum complanatum]|uniref:Uncharacterized protein n=1 Tax=Diphasiastrum complanatum TaxID=34168 RepID=A0ACC2BVR1_DIPCM|nr:hypothetical protein O6H91_13G069100 [Diphasiastrum complanatum]
MENDLTFVSCAQGASYVTDPKTKLLKAVELESAVGFGPDAFHVDDLLEFSNDVIGGPINGSYLADQSVESAFTATDVVGQHSSTRPIPPSHKVLDQNQVEKDFSLDQDEFAELDWLSNFVEDSCCTNEHLKLDYSQDLLLNLDMQSYNEMSATASQFKMTSPVSVLENSATSGSANSVSWETPLPARARSKRSRSGSKMWSSGVITSSSQDLTESDSYADSLLSFDCSDLSVDSPRFTVTGAGLLPNKKPSKPWRGRKLAQDGSEIRKCAHCLTQRTPQWRAGPAGPKTLCNACGVRYKSGRLFPEYRPALSPTFESDVHSNSHRKVLEMRRQKDMGLVHQKLVQP